MIILLNQFDLTRTPIRQPFRLPRLTAEQRITTINKIYCDRICFVHLFIYFKARRVYRNRPIILFEKKFIKKKNSGQLV
jgi:hypothetical protein